MRGLKHLGCLVGLVGLAACEPIELDLVTHPTDLWVAPNGNDAASGQNAATPLRTIAAALTRAWPGATIHLLPGVYDQDVTTVRHGRADAPIVIEGPRDAVVRGAGAARVVEIGHDHHWLSGFTIDGLAGDPEARAGYRDKLVFVLGREPRRGPVGTVLRGLRLAHAGGECVRLRYFVQGSRIENNDMGPCGVYDFRFAGGGENGQGVYIGTSLEQLTDGKNPTADRDASTGNVVHGNRVDTRGAECVAVKEAADGNRIEGNVCTGVARAELAGFDVRSNGNALEGNEAFGQPGVAVKLGGATDRDGVSNDVVRNHLHDNGGAALRLVRGPQGRVCGNRLANNGGGAVEGAAATGVDPTSSCP